MIRPAATSTTLITWLLPSRASRSVRGATAKAWIWPPWASGESPRVREARRVGGFGMPPS